MLNGSRGRAGRRLAVLAAGLLLSFGTIWGETIPPDDPGIRYVGRADFTDPAAPKMGWPGTGIRARFEGTSLRASFDDETGDNRIAVRIDGGEPRTWRLSAAPTELVLASGLADTVHEVEIVKKTEGTRGFFSFLGFELDEGKELQAVPEPSLRIEVYGDSNPAGYSSECTCDSGNAALQSADEAYPAVVARMLGGEHSSISWSGIGIVSGFAGQPMTGVWNRTLPQDAAPLWDFSRFVPDVVIVNIGANDFYAGESSAAIMAGWEAFVTDRLRPVYPEAQIVLMNAFGWAVGEPADSVAQSAQNLRDGGDSKISHLLIPWLWGQEHAVICEHAGYADLVASHIASILGRPIPPPNGRSCLGTAGKISKGDLESVFNGEMSIADGWRPRTSGSGQVELLDDPATAHGGHRAYRVEVGAFGTAAFSQSTAASPGEAFSARAFLRGDPGGVLSLEFRGQGQEVLLRVDSADIVGQTWTEHSVSAVAPAETWQVAVVGRVESTGTTVDFDDLTLRGPNLFADGFETGGVEAWSASGSNEVGLPGK